MKTTPSGFATSIGDTLREASVRIGYDLYAVERNRRLAEVEHFSRHLGGSSANIAVGLARLGLQVAMISCVGNDLLAEYLLDFLKREGINTDFVRAVDGYNTSLCLTEVSPPDPLPQVFYRSHPADLQVILGAGERSLIRKRWDVCKQWNQPGIFAAARIYDRTLKLAPGRPVHHIGC